MKTQKEQFSFVCVRQNTFRTGIKKQPGTEGMPWVSVGILAALVLGCLLAELIMTKDPTYLDLYNHNVAPNREFLFGTDNLGRDIFSCIWYGGRVSLFIGFFATIISTVIALVYGTASGLAPVWLDRALMRLAELMLSIPGLLMVLFVQAVIGKSDALSVSLAIGITSWCAIARIIRTEVRQLRDSEYIMAAKCMGGGFFHILRKHLAPNFLSSIMFMVVMNVCTAIGMEAALSFLGMGLPLETISWGSMLSLSERALTSGSWWMIVIPGGFLAVLMMSITNIGNWLRKRANPKEKNV